MKLGVIGASRYGITIVSCRIAGMILRDERTAIPIGSHQKKYGVTLSLPNIRGRHGLVEAPPSQLTAEEGAALTKSAESIRKALERVQ